MSKHSISRINKIIELMGYKCYLEVGVSKGNTFMSVRADEKTAVDPNFRFNPVEPPYCDAGIYYQETSDVFFTRRVNKKYDLIFLDGLHTYSQTLRDFCNAIEILTPKGVIIIDDTYPADIYSAYPNPHVARMVRRIDKNQPDLKAGWHGDVYKVVFTIAEFFPMWSYATIKSGGNPQTFIWRKARPVKAFKESIESISRLDYYDFLENIEYMNISDSYNEILGTIRNDLSLEA